MIEFCTSLVDELLLRLAGVSVIALSGSAEQMAAERRARWHQRATRALVHSRTRYTLRPFENSITRSLDHSTLPTLPYTTLVWKGHT